MISSLYLDWRRGDGRVRGVRADLRVHGLQVVLAVDDSLVGTAKDDIPLLVFASGHRGRVSPLGRRRGNRGAGQKRRHRWRDVIVVVLAALARKPDLLGLFRLATLAAKRSCCWSLGLLGHPEHTEDGCAEERVKRLDARFCGYLQGRVTHTQALGIHRPVVVDSRDCGRAIRVVGR